MKIIVLILFSGLAAFGAGNVSLPSWTGSFTGNANGLTNFWLVWPPATHITNSIFAVDLPHSALTLTNQSGVTVNVVDAGAQQLNDSLNTAVLNWHNRQLLYEDGSAIAVEFSNPMQFHDVPGNTLIICNTSKLLLGPASAGTTNVSVGTNLTVAGFTTCSKSVFLATNALSAWPTAPAAQGGSAIVSSNGYLYVLLATNGTAGSVTWTGTNRLGW